jgi:hypothetical protein
MFVIFLHKQNTALHEERPQRNLLFDSGILDSSTARCVPVRFGNFLGYVTVNVIQVLPEFLAWNMRRGLRRNL